MLYDFPIKYYENNLIFSEDGCWACFEVSGFDYDNRSTDNKFKILRNWINFFADVVSEEKILLIPIKQSYDERLKKNYQVMSKDDPLKKVARQHAESTVRYLELKQTEKIFVNKETGEEIKYVEDAINDYKTYVVVKIDDIKEKDFIETIQDSLEYLIAHPINSINKFLGLEEGKILESKLRAFKKASRAYFEKQSQRVQLKEVDDKITQWLFRRINLRGTKTKVKVTDFVPSAIYTATNDNDIEIKPDKEEIRGLFKGKVLQKDRYLEIKTDEDTSYQTFLSLTEKPAMKFPGSEYLFALHNIDIPIEVCVHIKNLDEHKSKQVVLGERKKVSSEIDNANEGSIKIDENTREAAVEVKNMEEEVRRNKKLTKTSITFCIANNNLEDLEKDVARFTTSYKDMGLILERPVSDQYKLYMECIPGAPRYTEDFARLMSIENLASMGIGASRVLGDDEGGYYIGTTGISKKVFLDMAKACLENKSASATFYGNLGYGKSFNANLLVVLHIIFGAYGLIFDPKGERTHWIEKLPWLKDLTSITELSSDDKYKGMLDPFNVYKDDVESACALALNVISEINKMKPQDAEYTILKESLVKIKSYEVRSMLKVVEILESVPNTDEYAANARKLARNMRTLQSIGMSKLLFGDGTEESLDFDNRLNILQISNLKMPTADVEKKEYDDEEVLSTTLMMVMSHFAKRFALIPRNNFKVILFDESWFLKNSSEGKKLYAYLTRMGRSLFTGCIFNGHSVLDIPSEEVKNTITYKFCFHTDEEEEAKRMCEYLKIDVSKENIEKIMQLENRECMFRDLDGRVGKLKFDAVFKDIIKCFDTTPKKAEENNNEEVAS
ncbi:ATP-binding protein [Clostridium saccharoperbutylacetonicum]|uniref:ATP-binding protein n=1 Tax=Clostridium saccharoperbutylacetonicum TaxID=36745 RepID=UPI0039E80419